MSDPKNITWEEQNVVSVFVKGVSIKAESGLKENDSDGSASPDQSHSPVFAAVVLDRSSVVDLVVLG